MDTSKQIRRVTTILYGLGAGLLGTPALGQAVVSPDSSARLAAAGSLRQHYAQTLRYESRLYDGPEYVSTVRHYVVGHPFFGSAEPQPATIEYGGATYPGVSLRYDLLHDQLVLPAPQGGLHLRLVNENVTRFQVGGHTFIRLAGTDSAGVLARPGFYDLLVDGPVQLLALRRKDLQERSTAGGMEGEITQKDEFFIYRGRRYYPAAKAGAVLALFPENKAALRKYIRAQKLKFSPARREEALVALIRYQATLAAPTPAAH